MSFEEEPTLPEELVPRTAALLVRGALPCVVATVLLVGVPLVLGVAATVLLEVSRSGRDQASWALLTLAALFCYPAAAVMTCAAPLAAFALAAQGGARVGPVLRRAFHAAWPITACVVTSAIVVTVLLAMEVSLARELLAGDGPLSGRLVLVPPLLGVLAFALYVHGSFVLFEGGCHALGVPRPKNYPTRTTREFTGAAALPLVALVAVVGGLFAPGAQLLPVAPLAGVLVIAAAHFVSCAVGVAIASRPVRSDA